MPLLKPLDIAWPRSTFPGSTPQESAGRLINCHAEPLGPEHPDKQAWHRAPGLTQFGNAVTGNTGYRGGLLVANLGYEAWSGNFSTTDPNGNITSFGNLPGTKKISIACDQNASGPDVVAVDIDNGAFVLATAGVAAAPTALTAIGVAGLPQPLSVTFQDGQFFFMSANAVMYASGVNALTFNGLTFEKMQARSDVTGVRAVAFAGLLFGFSSGHCEVWQDTAQPFPNFPYSRLIVLPYGLLQGNAIAGFETGFDTLIWVAQDFGVWMLPYGQLAPVKVSPPDLDRLIEAQSRAGNLLEAYAYVFAGKRFWALSSPAWTWEFNLGTSQWNERWSLVASTGQQGRWRAIGGHPAFGKWLGGDTQSGTLVYIDDTVITELGAPQLRRMESAPVDAFPNRLRVARADFYFSTGAGLAARALAMTVTGAAANGSGAIRLAVNSTITVATNDTVLVSGVTGTTEANGTWPITLVDATHIDLQGSHFVNAYVSGGTATDITEPPNIQNPSVAVSWSDDNGNRWGNPIVRSLGLQQKSLRTRVTVKNSGVSGPQARRWRIDDTDCAAPFVKATQSDDPKEY
jgi:hypothetical protein